MIIIIQIVIIIITIIFLLLSFIKINNHKDHTGMSKVNLSASLSFTRGRYCTHRGIRYNTSHFKLNLFGDGDGWVVDV